MRTCVHCPQLPLSRTFPFNDGPCTGCILIVAMGGRVAQAVEQWPKLSFNVAILGSSLYGAVNFQLLLAACGA